VIDTGSNQGLSIRIEHLEKIILSAGGLNLPPSKQDELDVLKERFDEYIDRYLSNKEPRLTSRGYCLNIPFDVHLVRTKFQKRGGVISMTPDLSRSISLALEGISVFLRLESTPTTDTPDYRPSIPILGMKALKSESMKFWTNGKAYSLGSGLAFF
jgi:hypothetical protein